MKILGKTYSNADFRKILRNSEEKVKKNLGKTCDHCKAVLRNCEIDYIVLTSTITTTVAFMRSRQEGSNALSLVDLSESDLIQTTRFPGAAVIELCQLIADGLVRPTDHVTYATPTIGR